MSKKLSRAKRKELGLKKPSKASVEKLAESVGMHDDERDEPRPVDEIEHAREERAKRTEARTKRRDRTMLVVIGLLVFATLFLYFAPSLWKSSPKTASSAEPSAGAPILSPPGAPLMTSTARVLEPKKETGSPP